MLNVLLLNPPRDNLVHLDTPGNVDLGEISSFPPIGLMYLAEYLRQSQTDVTVAILDSVAEHLSHEQTTERITAIKPDILGITAFTYTFYDVCLAAKDIKKRMPLLPIVVGGPHMYIFASETMTHDCFDYGVVGDGEHVFANICSALNAGRPVLNEPGLLIASQLAHDHAAKTLGGKQTAFVADLDEVRTPAIDLIKHELYYNTIGKKGSVGTIATSRGCPFRCTFCQVPHTKYRMRSVKNVVTEIEAYIQLGVTDFFFFDDLFNITKQRVTDFCEEVLRRNLNITWMFRGRVDQIDSRMLELCWKTGCHTISVGVEDATDEGLAAINKGITIAQAMETVKLIRKHGIKCSTNWIIGFPHHSSRADLENILNTALAMNADYAQFSILQCLPGSALYDQAVSERGIDPEQWRSYVLHPVKSFAPPIWERHFKKEQLFEFYEHAFRKYYLRPSVILREVARIRSWGEARNKLASFLTVFKK